MTNQARPQCGWRAMTDWKAQAMSIVYSERRMCSSTMCENDDALLEAEIAAALERAAAQEREDAVAECREIERRANEFLRNPPPSTRPHLLDLNRGRAQCAGDLAALINARQRKLDRARAAPNPLPSGPRPAPGQRQPMRER